MKGLSVIILAAGKGKRMRSGVAKVLHPLLGRPMLSYPLEVVLDEVRPEKTVLVIGHQADVIRQTFADPRITFCHQQQQLGTGHAVAVTADILRGFPGTILILSGDTPLLRGATLRGMVDHHKGQGADLTIMTATREDPNGYGRVVRASSGKVRKIVEEKDATEKELGVREINAGVYCIEAPFLFTVIATLRPENAQGEYYLTDIVEEALRQKKRVATYTPQDPDEALGINTRIDLANAEEILADRIRRRWMQEGVTIHDPKSVYIESTVHIGADTVIFPNTYLNGDTFIGEGCLIGPHVQISSSRIGNRVEVRFCTFIKESTIADDVIIGPFSHLRPQSQIERGAKIGNFVEVKKSRIGEGTKANHLAYIGDAQVGRWVNIGAGAITCNYDGYQKHRTIIEDGVFVGSNASLVAPLSLGEGSVVGAGTTVTRDVPPHALAVGRAKQKLIRGWRKKIRE